jgi:hypothetical protein
MKRLIVASALLACCLPATEAAAFCGFYVSGADGSLFNDATQVVLMRDGTRTVLSMQNAYKGPPQDFAMVVPVPVVLKEGDVKTLPHDLFKKVDLLDAPRLVEYWEQDPCGGFGTGYGRGAPAKSSMAKDDDGARIDVRDHGVKIEAQFTVGEYEIVILSAKDSTGLDAWLREKQYKIPAGAEPFLRPYVQSGMKFFVAKVNIKKVKVVAGRAVLSPLRMHYDSEEFVLPIRLGLANSAGTQDLIVHILAPETRYEAANYDNVTIPTNLDVAEAARDQFGAFYAALFDRTVATHPLALVTEYAWDASSCDPCPLPPLEPGELATLGGDVIASGAESSFVLTRLHLRYPKDFRGDDLVFRKAYPIAGGREMEDEGGHIERRVRPDEWNNFQARYVIRHPWTAPITCADPQRGIWGPPPPKPGQEDTYDPWSAQQKPVAASDLAYAARGGVALGMMIAEDVPEIGVKQGDAALAPPTLGTVPEVHKRSGCGCQTTGSEQIVGVAFICLVALFACHRRR